MHELNVQKGTVIVYLAYDIGREVDLEKAALQIQDRVLRPQLASDRRQPKYFGYDPLPVRFNRTARPISLAGFETPPEVECTVWDFGGLTIGFKFQIPAGTSLESLIPLSAALDETELLEVEGNDVMNAVVSQLGDALKGAATVDTVEDYIIFRIAELSERISGSRLSVLQSPTLAQIVRAERVKLAHNVVEETMSHRVSYRAAESMAENADLTIIGWNAAFTYGQEDDPAGDDLCAVLEFTLAYLLEMRLLDEKLDDYLDDAYAVSLRPNRWFHADFSRVGVIQIDAAMLFEAVHNALKLIGDEFLAEVQRVAAERFRFEELDKTIRRKLNTLQEIYQKLSDRNAHRRSETLEVIIIILIILELVLR